MLPMPTSPHFLQVLLGSCQILIFNWVGRILFLVLCGPLSPVSCSSTSLPCTVSFMKGLLENGLFVQLHEVLMAGQRMDPVRKISYLSQGKSLFILLLHSKPQPWPPVVPTMCYPTNQIVQMKSSQNFSLPETCPHHSPASGRDHMELSSGVSSAFSPSPGALPFSLSPKSSSHSLWNQNFFISLHSFFNSLPRHLPWPLFYLEKHKQTNTNVKPKQSSNQNKIVFPGWSFILYSLPQNLSNPSMFSCSRVFFACWPVSYYQSTCYLQFLQQALKIQTDIAQTLPSRYWHLTTGTGRPTNIWNKVGFVITLGYEPTKEAA